MFTQEQREEMKGAMGEVFQDVVKEKLSPMVGELVAQNCKEIVDQLAQQKRATGKDLTGLNDKAKKDFVEVARAAAKMEGVSLKANEALIEEQDNRGGYLVSREVADAILRIAASVGTILSQAQKWPMQTDELGIPNYTGAFLTGSYLNVDVAGTVQGLTFGQAILVAKKWQLAFVVGNDLLVDANVNLADWLLALAGEALANMIDQQGFVGTGAPFVGILNEANVATYTNGNSSTSGCTKFSNSTYSATDGYKVLTDSSNVIGQLEESILDGAAFYIHRTVWAVWRSQQDSSGNFILPFAGIPLAAGLPSAALADLPGGGPIKPAGEILGYPVYTNRWLPALPASNGASASTAFAIFGNMKSMAFGDKGDMRVAQFESGSFGGKEVALADQKGIVYKHRHALSIVLPKAFVVISTSAS